MRSVEKAARAGRVAQKQGRGVVAGHAASGTLKHLFGYAARLVGDQKHVLAVYACEAFRALFRACPGGAEGFRGAALQHDAVAGGLKQL